MRILLLLSLLASARALGISGWMDSCPPGHRRVAGHCIALPTLNAEAQCDCVPFYQCELRHVKGMRSKCKIDEVCCERGAPADEDCGWGLVGTRGADEAVYGEFPWVVAILNITTNETWTRDEYIGGGSIITPRMVLTAAHKIKGKAKEQIKCRAGEWSRLTPELNPVQDRLVAQIHVHPAYDRLYLANDVALLELKEAFSVPRAGARAVCVGAGAPRGACVAVGWGRRQYNSSDPDADKLKKVELPLVSREVCWMALRAADDARRRARGQKTVERRELHSSLLCAGGQAGRDACSGDGGSPLVCQLQANATHARWAVYGLVAWGIGCGALGAPGVYVDVAQFHAWIQGVVAP